MHKRILSIVLCLAMMMSFAVPAYATDGTTASDDIFIADDIIVSDGEITTSFDEDGNIVIKTEPKQEAEVNETTDETAEAVETEAPVEETEALVEETEAPVEETEAPAEETEAPVEETEAPTEETEAEEEITVEEIVLTGEAMATIAGTTVNVSGIPEGGSITVQDPADSLAVEQADDADEMIFLWDISVQDANGAEWQPEGEETVHVELNVPGVKLHKYTKVYVMHIDDEGNESRIEATVTEDGKVAFETPGFSTFAGFTVDFSFEGVEFSIPGETSILLSQVFEKLQAPLNVADVADVEFTNYELITVTKVDGDWELTSLLAFDTTETLTITMKDGEVHEITVTDYHPDGIWATTWPVNEYGDNFAEPNTPDISTTTNSIWNFSQDHDITITPGSCKKSQVVINMRQIHIQNGVKVNFTLDESFDNSNIKEVVFKANDTWALILIREGRISFTGREGTRIVLENRASTETNPSNYPTIYTYYGNEAEIELNYVTFRNTNRGAIGLCTDRAASVKLDHCVFESTVVNDYYGGGAIFVSDVYQKDTTNNYYNTISTNHGNNYSDVTLMQISNCRFDGVTTTAEAAKLGYGGAIGIFGKVDKLEISNSQFTNCKAYCGGGAISIGGSAGMVNITGCTFDSCRAVNYCGGAIHTWTRRIAFPTETDTTVGQYTRVNTLNITDTQFKNGYAYQDGGAIGIQGQLHTLNISGTTQFIDNQARTRGGAIGLASTGVPQHGTTTTGGATIYFTSGYDDTDTYGVVNATVQPYTKDGTTTRYTTIKNVNITGQIIESFNSKVPGDEPTFWTVDGGVTQHQAGFLAVAELARVDSLVMNRLAIKDCETMGEGSCVYLHGTDILDFQMNNCWVQGCDFTKNEDGKYTSDKLVGGTIRTTGGTGTTMRLYNCYFKNNTSIINGGAVYFNANGDKREDLSGKKLHPNGCSATIENCHFNGNRAYRDGGAIFCESNVTVKNCLIQNNYARMGGGIAQQIYSNAGRPIENGESTKLKLDSSTVITNNHAVEYNGEFHNTSNENLAEMISMGGNGGGISIMCNYTAALPLNTTMAYPVEFVLGGATIHDNFADFNGGGIYYITLSYDKNAPEQKQIDQFVKKITIDEGNIYNNVAGQKGEGGNGGGIYMESPKLNDDATGSTTLLITGGHIYNNTANGGDGGAIYLVGRKAECTITGGVIGGAKNVIYNEDGTATVTDATPNIAKRASSRGGHGGGIAISGGAKISMTGGEISHNKALRADDLARDCQGGGIWLANKGSGADDIANTMTLSGGTVLLNSTPGGTDGNGGGIYIGTGNSFELTNGSVKYNTCGTAFGGGIAARQSTLTIKGGTISHNTAGSGGGIVMESSGCVLNFTGGEISDNTCNDFGGGLYATFGSTITINGGDILRNVSLLGNGGGIRGGYMNLTFTNGNISENRCDNKTSSDSEKGYGGGIYCDNLSTITLSGGNITDNEAKFGGGMAVHHSTAYFNNGTISGNYAANGGGLHASNGATVTVSGGDIIDNEANYYFVNGGNLAHGCGGGIYCTNSTVLVQKSEDSSTVGNVSNNLAIKGGGVFVYDGGDLTVNNGFITGNRAQVKASATTALGATELTSGIGGGIYIAEGQPADTTNSKPENKTTFTMTGSNIGIYNNIADFAADDVFANGNHTKLNVPTVAGMNLEGYDFPAAGWVEDYPVNDTNYEDGLNLGTSKNITNGSNVYRYRFSRPGFRIVVPEANVTTEKFAPNVANEYVCMTLGIPTAEPDVVVVDFGLPVNIDVSANDLIIDVEPIHGFVVDEHVNSKGYNEASPNSDGSCSLCNKEGTQNSSGGFVLNDDKHSATFTPADMNFSGAQTVNYVVHYSIKDSNGADKFYHFYSTVTAIPATNIYYEDSFLTFTDAYNANTNFGKWVEVTDETAATASTDVTQQQDRPGEDVNNALGALDADNVYGYDEAYKNCTTYSLGSAMKVTVDKSTGSANNAPTANFTFTGTGFDVVSLTNSDSGCVWVTVKDKDGQQVKSVIVSNYYGYTYNTTTGEWEVDPNESDCLYQVPVIKVDDLAYGTYNVEIKVVYLRSQDMDWNKDNVSTQNYTVWLDAIRIYNPAQGNEDAENAYKADNEFAPTYVNISDHIANGFDSFANATGGFGYVDGKDYGYSDDDKNAFITEYKNQGPNNEAYLKENDGFVFKLRYYGEGNPEGGQFHVGAKLATSGTTSTGSAANGSATLVVTYQKENSWPTVQHNIQTCTSMFYKGVELTWPNSGVDDDGKAYRETNVIYVRSTGNTNGAILSLTDLKITLPVVSASENAVSEDDLKVIVDTEAAGFVKDIWTAESNQVKSAINLTYPTLSFEDEVKYNFYYTVKNIDVAVEDMGLITWSTKPEDATFENAETVIPGASYNAATGEYMVRTNGIPAKKLGDNVYFRVYAKLSDGSYVYSQMTCYSAKIYAFDRLDNSNSADMKAACVAMLNYGAAAQKHFGYKTDVLMNADLTAEQKALADAYSSDMVDALPAVDAGKAGEFVANGGFTTGYPTVSFEGAFAINYYFVPNKTIDGDLTLYCWDLETYNSVDVLTADNATAKIVMTQTATGEYLATYTGIAAKQIDETVFVAGVYESEGVRYSTNVVPYSVGAYCADRVAYGSDTMKVFAAETAVFGHYAEIYFDNLNK